LLNLSIAIGPLQKENLRAKTPFSGSYKKKETQGIYIEPIFILIFLKITAAEPSTKSVMGSEMHLKPTGQSLLSF